MKNKILVACFALVALGTTSCKKSNHICRCTGPGTTVRTYPIEDKTRKDAKNECNDRDSGTPQGDVVCELQ